MRGDTEVISGSGRREYKHSTEHRRCGHDSEAHMRTYGPPRPTSLFFIPYEER